MSKRIAIVEDDPTIRANYCDALKAHGYEVAAYAERKTALEALRTRLPDLALLDIGLDSDVDGGYALCRELRALSPVLPIIFLTARDSDFDIVSGLRMGAALAFLSLVAAELTGASSGIGEVLRQQEASADAGKALAEKATVLKTAEAERKPEGWRGVIVSVSALVIPCLFVLFMVVATMRGVKIYEEFVQGAKEGWDVAVRIMPFLVAILVAMGIFRDSGALTLLQWAVSPVLNLIGFPSELLPLALMRPLSGSGSAGLMAEILSQPELPNLIKYTAATMFGSTETTFYVLAVYFGSVAVRKSRHAVIAGLGGDITGMIASVIFCRLMLG
jgi:spore maturation protein SpmB/CheY-like chemotaxis protein